MVDDHPYCRPTARFTHHGTGSDDNILLKLPRRMSLEAALEYIEDDELVEITPQSVRLRKKLLQEHERRRAGRL